MEWMPVTAQNKLFWKNRLSSLYDEAKRRNRGNSLSIYGEVSKLLDYLDQLQAEMAERKEK